MALIYTIGHSNHDIADFLHLLKTYGIAVVADVRSEPYSRRWPQYSRAQLKQFLLADSYRYVYLGNALGGRPKDASLYSSDGLPDYDKITGTDSFQNGVSQVLEIARVQRLALLCAEGLPSRCHRESLIANHLRSLGHTVLHILPDGETLDTQQLTLL